MEPTFPRIRRSFKPRAASFWTDFFPNVHASPCSGSGQVIRTVALGMVCLAGLGAIAVAAKKSTPPPRPEVVVPAVSNNKADRLPTIISQADTQTDAERAATAEKVDVAYVASADQNAPNPRPAAARPAATQDSASARDPDIAPRHRHERHHVRARTERRRAIAKPKVRPADPPPAQVSELKECRTDGLHPLMRQLNLSPQC